MMFSLQGKRSRKIRVAISRKDGEMVNLEWTGEIEDGEYIIIDENMSQWIGELKQEIKKLRGGN